MKTLQVTIYDIAGYLIPGLIATSGLAILFWTFLVPVPLNFDVLSIAAWVVIGVVSYIVGHLVQGMANLLIRSSTVSLVLQPGGQEALAGDVILKGQLVANEICELAASSNLPPTAVFDICDTYLQQRGKTEARDIYVYREGFYRGLAFAFVILSCGLLVRAFCQKSAFQAGGALYQFTTAQMLTGAAFCGLTSYVCFRRFRRFGRYLVSNSLLSAIILHVLAETPKLPRPENGGII